MPVKNGVTGKKRSPARRAPGRTNAALPRSAASGLPRSPGPRIPGRSAAHTQFVQPWHGPGLHGHGVVLLWLRPFELAHAGAVPAEISLQFQALGARRPALGRGLLRTGKFSDALYICPVANAPAGLAELHYRWPCLTLTT